MTELLQVRRFDWSLSKLSDRVKELRLASWLGFKGGSLEEFWFAFEDIETMWFFEL